MQVMPLLYHTEATSSLNLDTSNLREIKCKIQYHKLVRFKHSNPPSVFKLVKVVRVSVEKARSWLPAFPRNQTETGHAKFLDIKIYNVQSIKHTDSYLKECISWICFSQLTLQSKCKMSVKQNDQDRHKLEEGEKKQERIFHLYLTFSRQIKIIYRYCCRLPIVFTCTRNMLLNVLSDNKDKIFSSKLWLYKYSKPTCQLLGKDNREQRQEQSFHSLGEH